MPDWFAVDQWFPSLFEVRNLCSYTPDMLFGISMAEGLLGIAVALLVISTGTLLSLLMLAKKNPRGEAA
jgi:disulfide bond formation protein DsbB